jgi:hypothetical protein
MVRKHLIPSCNVVPYNQVVGVVWGRPETYPKTPVGVLQNSGVAGDTDRRCGGKLAPLYKPWQK